MKNYKYYVNKKQVASWEFEQELLTGLFFQYHLSNNTSITIKDINDEFNRQMRDLKRTGKILIVNRFEKFEIVEE